MEYKKLTRPAIRAVIMKLQAAGISSVSLAYDDGGVIQGMLGWATMMVPAAHSAEGRRDSPRNFDEKPKSLLLCWYGTTRNHAFRFLSLLRLGSVNLLP